MVRGTCLTGMQRRHGVLKSRVPKGLSAWVLIPALTLPSCVLLDKLLDFSVPHFLTCKVRIGRAWAMFCTVCICCYYSWHTMRSEN